MEKKLSAQEICELIKKDIPNTPTIGYKCFQPVNSPEEFVEICNYMKATENLISYKKIQKIGCMSQANWCPEIQKAEVTKQVGSCWSSMGHMENKKLYLYPEEALHLLEMGLLELKYNGLPISVQRAYSVLLEPLTNVSHDCYKVYSELLSNGYRVIRHLKSNKLTKYEKQLQIHKAGIKIKLRDRIKKLDMDEEMTGSRDDELTDEEIENIDEIFQSYGTNEDKTAMKDLQIFKLYKSNQPSKLNVHYDVFLASDGKSNFKKSHLQLPKARVVVHRGSDPMPDLKDIQSLSQQYQDDVPIIHAIVFPEFVTFYDITPITTPECN